MESGGATGGAGGAGKQKGVAVAGEIAGETKSEKLAVNHLTPKDEHKDNGQNEVDPLCHPLAILSNLMSFAISLLLYDASQSPQFLGGGVPRTLGKMLNNMFLAYYGYVLVVTATRLLKRA